LLVRSQTSSVTPGVASCGSGGGSVCGRAIEGSYFFHHPPLGFCQEMMCSTLARPSSVLNHASFCPTILWSRGAAGGNPARVVDELRKIRNPAAMGQSCRVIPLYAA